LSSQAVQSLQATRPHGLGLLLLTHPKILRVSDSHARLLPLTRMSQQTDMTTSMAGRHTVTGATTEHQQSLHELEGVQRGQRHAQRGSLTTWLKGAPVEATIVQRQKGKWKVYVNAIPGKDRQSAAHRPALVCLTPRRQQDLWFTLQKDQRQIRCSMLQQGLVSCPWSGQNFYRMQGGAHAVDGWDVMTAKRFVWNSVRCSVKLRSIPHRGAVRSPG